MGTKRNSKHRFKNAKQSYQDAAWELRFQELKQDKRARSEQRQQWKTLSKQMRNASRPSRD